MTEELTVAEEAIRLSSWVLPVVAAIILHEVAHGYAALYFGDETAKKEGRLSLNPLKLAGQCAKLKCCLNYEVDAYVEAGRRLPYKDVTLETIDSTYYFFKADILSGQVTYSTDKHIAANLVTIPARRAMEVIAMNKRGEKPDRLDNGDGAGNDRPRSADLLEQESVTRFDNCPSRHVKFLR